MAVAIVVLLVCICVVRTIVAGIRYAIAISVGAMRRRVAQVTRTVAVRVFLVRLGVVGAVVVLVADPLVVGVARVVTGLRCGGESQEGGKG